MKNYIIALLCIMLTSVAVNGQSKKDLEAKVTELETELNTVKADFSSLTAVHDSTSAVLDTYIGMYKMIQEKVLPYDFKPEDMGSIIDSLQTTRDSTFSSLMAGSASLRDTLSIMSSNIDSLNTQIESQKAEIEKLNAQIEELSGSSAIISDEKVAALEKIKKLLDSGILTQEEFDARKKLILGED